MLSAERIEFYRVRGCVAMAAWTPGSLVPRDPGLVTFKTAGVGGFTASLAKP